MAVLAEYTPPGKPGFAVDSAIQGYDAALSFSERKQQMALQQQRADQQRMEFIAKLPLIQAEATLKTVNAKAAVDNATEMTQLESRAALESVGANKEFLDALQYNVATDPNYSGGATENTPEGAAASVEQDKQDTRTTLQVRSQKLASLAAKYSYMSLIPQYKGFVQTLNKEASNAHTAAAADLKLEELMNTARMHTEATTTAASTRLEGTKYTADTKATTAGIYTGSRERIAAINADNRLSVEDKRGKIAAEKQASSIEALQNNASQADQAAADASAAGDEQSAAAHRAVASSYRDAVQKATTFAGTAPQAVPTKSPAVRPHPAPVDTSPSPSISVSIPGSDLPPSGEASAAAPPATPTEAASHPTATAHPAPVKVASWEQAKSLKSGTQYVGPDGKLYTRK